MMHWTRNVFLPLNILSNSTQQIKPTALYSLSVKILIVNMSLGDFKYTKKT